MSVDLKTFLVGARASRRPVDLGQFKFLNLPTLRSSAGNHWPKLRRRVFASSANFLETRVRADDAIIPCDEGFLVLFAEMCGHRQGTVTELGDGLRTLLSSRAETQTLGLQALATTIAIDDAASLAPINGSNAAVSEPASSQEGSISSWYRPIWDMQRQLVAANACVTRSIVGGHELDSRHVLATSITPLNIAELDRTCHRTAIQGLRQLLKQNKPQTFCLSIHAASFDDPEMRQELLAGLSGLPDAVRKHLLVRVDGLELDPDRTVDALRELAQIHNGLIADVPFADPNLGRYADCGVTVFASQIRPSSSPNSGGLPEHETRRLADWVASARLLGAETLIEEISDLRVLKHVMSTGVRWLAGSAVASDRREPTAQIPLTLIDICRTAKAA